MVEKLIAQDYCITLGGYVATEAGFESRQKVIQYTTDQGIEHVLRSIKFGHVDFAVTSIHVYEM